jgi:hypothetical protein
MAAADLTFRATVSLCAIAASAVAGGPAAGAATPNYAVESEYTWNYSFAAINAAAAFAAGYNGKGVTVAVLDSGINRSNADLSAPGKVLAGYDFVDGRAGVPADALGHGTFVSGIIAAARNGWGVEGVAYGSTILPEQIINSAGTVSVSDAGIGQAIAYGFSNHARIFNNSWNSSTTIAQVSKAQIAYYYPKTIAAAQQAVTNGALLVFAAGNDAKIQVGFWAGLPALFPGLKPGWIAAVATDQTGRIAAYSDRCGASAAWCMAAPGSNIVSDYGGYLGTGNGTSFAAPAISGAAAVLLQEFPNLTAAQAGQILLKTATKTGIYADTATYGQGLLNLAAAIQPIGTPVIPTGAQGAIKVAAATAKTSPAKRSGEILGLSFGGGFGRAIGPVLVLDDYRRAYVIDGSALVHGAATGFDTVDLLGRFGNEELAEIAPGVRAAFAEADANTPAGLPRMRVEIAGGDGQTFETSFGVDPALAFGNLAGGTVPADALIVQDGVGNPYLNLAQNGPAVKVALPASFRPAGAAVSVGLFEGYSHAASLTMRAGDPSYAPPHVFGAIVEAARSIDAIGARIAFDVGAVIEQGAFLGTTSSGAFGSTGDTPTTFAGLNGTMRILPGLTLIGSYHLGWSSPATPAGGLVTGYGVARTESFSIGLVADGVARKNDRAGFTVSEPLRVSGGSARLTVPFALDPEGNVVSRNVAAPLAADGRELDLQGFYAGRLNDGLKFDAGMVARFEPDNQRSAPTEMVALVKLRQSF